MHFFCVYYSTRLLANYEFYTYRKCFTSARVKLFWSACPQLANIGSIFLYQSNIISFWCSIYKDTAVKEFLNLLPAVNHYLAIGVLSRILTNSIDVHSSFALGFFVKSFILDGIWMTCNFSFYLILCRIKFLFLWI